MLEAGGNVQWQDDQLAALAAVNRVPTSQTRDQRYDFGRRGLSPGDHRTGVVAADHAGLAD